MRIHLRKPKPAAGTGLVFAIRGLQVDSYIGGRSRFFKAFARSPQQGGDSYPWAFIFVSLSQFTCVSRKRQAV